MTAETYSPAWLAPVATKELRAEISLPGSKSLNNRELVLSALASGPTTLHGVLKSRDSDLMIAALRALGTEILENIDGSLTIIPVTEFTGAKIDCGLAG
ncbi:MAG: 3-phosphoshikimate 1-carboxyvinyltransferase, partial [Actinobacteria bacterium]|nr:3-phosphoshikimate 1-carboxyvinyltransferase [Actinomycetota bacterium]